MYLSRDDEANKTISVLEMIDQAIRRLHWLSSERVKNPNPC
jgi:hypothetical protein